MLQFSPEAIAAAQAAQRTYGCPASVTLAQYLIESSCGKYEPPGSNNPFGIKARPGEPFVSSMTTEYINGKAERIPQNFRKFASLTEAFAAHAKLFVDVSLYHDALAHADNPDEFVRLMATHYATAPTYAEVLIRVMKADNLYQYDVGGTTPPAIAAAMPPADPQARRKWIQSFLVAHGAAIDIDGEIGVESEAAIADFLAKHAVA